MSIRSFPDGVFPSVALGGGRGCMAVREGDPRQPGAIVLSEWIGTDIEHAREIGRWSLPAGSPAFPGLYIYKGLLWLAYHDGMQQVLRNVTSGTAQTFSGLSNPTAFGGPFFAYCEPVAPYRVHMLDLRTGEGSEPRTGAPTGLSRIIQGMPILIDEDRMALAGATLPSFAGDHLAVGEGPNGGALWEYTVTLQDVRRGLLWFPLDNFTPKCAADGDLMAICSGGSGSVRLFCGALADLVAASTAPVQPPAPPVPVPVPPPIPEPVPTMTLPQNIKEIRDRYVARFPVPQGQGPEDFAGSNAASDFFENKCRAWVRGLAEQVRYETNDPAWGVKNAGGGRPQSKDSLANNGARLINYDLLTGVGTGHPGLVPDPQGEDITGQAFMPVEPVNRLDVPVPVPDPTPVPVPNPTPTPTPGMDAELRAFLTDLVAANRDQVTQIKGLRSDVKKAAAALAVLLAKKK